MNFFSSIIFGGIYFDIILLLFINLLLWLWCCFRPPHVIKLSRFPIQSVNGLALPGLIFLSENAFNEDVLRHEFIHIQQMRRYSPLGVAIILLVGYLYLFFKYLKTHHRVPRFFDIYVEHPIEREAFAGMKNQNAIGSFTGDVPPLAPSKLTQQNFL